jgi:hypothetical protein
VNVSAEDIESDVLTESENESDQPLPNSRLTTPLKSSRVNTLEGFNSLSGWDGGSHGFSDFEFGSKEKPENDNNRVDNGSDEDKDDDDQVVADDEDGEYTDDYQSFNEEEENYKKFIDSIRLNADRASEIGLDANFLFDEDLDEDDYFPDEATDEHSDSNDDDVEDSLDDINDLLNNNDEELNLSSVNNQFGEDSPVFGVPVKRKELAALLGDCWLTIAGNSSQPAVNEQMRTTSSRVGNEPLQSHSLLSSLMAQFFTGNKTSEPTIDGFPIHIYRTILARQMSMALQLLLHILIQSEDRSHAFAASYQSLLQLHNHRLNAVKKAALLQMNMEAFLAAKQAQSHSQSHQEQPTQDARLFKQHQIQALMEEVAPHLVQRGQDSSCTENLSSAEQMQAANSLQPNASFREVAPPRSQEGTANNTIPPSTTPHRVLTRSGLINYNAYSRRSSSVLDVPILSNLNELLKYVDQAQKRYKAQVLQFAIVNNMATFFNNQFLLSDHAAQNIVYRQFLLQSSALQLEEVYRSMPGSKLWKSLIPTSSYPFPQSFWLHLDSTSIVGKSFFTPAEDDLLIRGILKYGDIITPPQHVVDMSGRIQLVPGHDSWSLIQRDFFPARSTSSLQFHYQQKTSAAMQSVLDAALVGSSMNSSLGVNGSGMFDFLQTQNMGNNVFKRFQWIRSKGWIVSKRPHERRWQHTEDINLLRGYQVVGYDWNLLTKIFLPHRTTKDVRIRWKMFLKIWQKTFPNFEQRARQLIAQDTVLVSNDQFDSERAIVESLLSPKLQAFLQDVQECNSYKSLLALEESGQGRHLEAFEKQQNEGNASQLLQSMPSTLRTSSTSKHVDGSSFAVPRLPASWLQYGSSLQDAGGATKAMSDRGVASLFAPLPPSPLLSSHVDPATIQAKLFSALLPYTSLSATAAAVAAANMGTLPPQHYAALTRVHDVFDFDHAQWGDISCDELSDEENSDIEVPRSRKRKSNKDRHNIAHLPVNQPEDRDEVELQDSSDDDRPRPLKTHSRSSRNMSGSHTAVHLARAENFVANIPNKANQMYPTVNALPQPSLSAAFANPFVSNVASARPLQVPHNAYTGGSRSDTHKVNNLYVGHKRPISQMQTLPSLTISSLEQSNIPSLHLLDDSIKRQRNDPVSNKLFGIDMQPFRELREISSKKEDRDMSVDEEKGTAQVHYLSSIDDAPPSVHGLEEIKEQSHIGIEELLGFSNITRDMSRIRADILAEEQLQEQQDSHHHSESNSQLPNSNSNENAPHGKTGLFASVMRGAN